MALTLLLTDKWDIQLDGNGNIATVDADYAIAQNAANAVRLFTNDAYFDRDKGIPHFSAELGKKPAPARAVLTNRIRKAVMAVDGVVDAEIDLVYNTTTRVYGGEITITTVNSQRVSIEL